MRTPGRNVAVVGVAAVVVVTSGCGGSESGGGANETGGAPTGSVLVNGCTPENPFIPSSTNDVCGGEPLDAIMAKLVRYDAKTAAPVNDIAESIESDDASSWTIKLKPGWRFSDGTEVRAKNFVDAWNWAAYGPNAQENGYFFEPIEGYADVQSGEDPDGDGPQAAPEPAAKTMSGLQLVDDTTFTVETTSPTSNLPVRLGYTAFSPLPDSFFADNGAAYGKAPVGAGPYKFVSYTEGDSIKLTANETYSGDVKPQVKDLTFKIYQNIDAAYVDLVAGNLDLLDMIPVSALAGESYKSDLDDRYVDQASGTIQSIAFPLYDAKFQNIYLRKAISQAIDREAIIRNVFAGSRVAATGYVSPIVDGYKAGACGDACVFDPDAARASLQKAGGYSGVLTIAYNADGGHKAWVDATCVSIKNAVGIDCQGKSFVDFATFLADRNERRMDGMFFSGWQMDYPSIENFLAPIYATGASSNDGEYSNPRFDDLLKQAAAASGDEANRLYQEAESVLGSDFPVIPLWYRRTLSGYSDKIEAPTLTPFGVPDWTSITLR